MSTEKKFDPLYDDISSEDILRYFVAKNIIVDGQSDLNCSLCKHNSFSFTDSMPFFPAPMGNQEIKYRLSLQPKLIKPASMYAMEYAQRNLDSTSETKSPPFDMMLKTPEIRDIMEHANSREYLVLTCNNCGNTLMIERDKIVEFLLAEKIKEEL